MTTSHEKTLIVGGGLAAVRTAQALRDQEYPGSITILSDEKELPYDRPPLSKNYLLGKSSDEDIRLLPADSLSNLRIDLQLDKRAVGLNRLAREVKLANGEAVKYDRLVIATGAQPVLPVMFQGRKNVFILRSVEDARRLRDVLQQGACVGIVGGGFIGLEIASAGKFLGCQVTVIEAADAPLVRSLGVELGRHVQHWHEAKGISFRCGSPVTKVQGIESVTSLELANGESLSVDIVVVGVGQKPNIDWLSGSGLELHNGLVCDSSGRTSDPAIFGVGDVTCCHADGKCTPTFHWTATTDQAPRVAKLICDKPETGPFIDDHYFWSDQHGSRIQFVGHITARPRITFVVGTPQEEKFVALCCDDDEVTAVFSLGSPRDFLRYGMPLRRGERVPVPV